MLGSSCRTQPPDNPHSAESHTKGYFHSTRASAAMRMGLLRVRQHRARGARNADLLACMAFLAPPPLFLAEPVDPRVSDFPPSPPGGASFTQEKERKGIVKIHFHYISHFKRITLFCVFACLLSRLVALFVSLVQKYSASSFV